MNEMIVATQLRRAGSATQELCGGFPKRARNFYGACLVKTGNKSQ
jgi:hypothetical protein